MTIQELWSRCKRALESDRLFTVLLVVVVSLASFGLGRLSVYEHEAGGQAAAIPAASGSAGGDTAVLPGGVVASTGGTRYHLPWCAGAQQIRKENEVWFESAAAARAAGYLPAANCKGI